MLGIVKGLRWGWGLLRSGKLERVAISSRHSEKEICTYMDRDSGKRVVREELHMATVALAGNA